MRARTGHITAGLLWTLGLLLIGSVTLAPRDAEARVDRFVRVRVSVANLRTGPSHQAALVRQAYQNEPLRVLGARGDWLQVRDAADAAAWINSELTDGRATAVIVRELVNVREHPGTGFPIVFTAERGVNLLVLKRSGRWLRVRHDVGEGWLHDSLVWGPP
jgi:SH3-like domain-containing protein